jgi:type IV pilus assembly protein PilC
MLFSPRIKLRNLAGLCRRSATALGAGIDVRTVWAREAGRAAGRAIRGRLLTVSEGIHRGESMADALAATGDFFPPLFRELVQVGEQSGHLSEVFARLADHYEGRLKLRRIFLGAIAWPLIELAAAVVVIGFLIWIMGVIGHGIDPLGFGLVGNKGLMIYVAFLATVGVLFVLILEALRRGLVWTGPIQRAVLRLPVLGRALQTLALARMAWALHLTLNTSMDVRRALRLSLRSTRNARYTDQIQLIEKEITAGNSIHAAFVAAGCFPTDFLDAVAVGEQSGELVESMARLSQLYQDQAYAALAALNVLAGFAVYAAVAMVIILLIFRLAGFYFGTLNEVLKW